MTRLRFAQAPATARGSTRVGPSSPNTVASLDNGMIQVPGPPTHPTGLNFNKGRMRNFGFERRT